MDIGYFCFTLLLKVLHKYYHNICVLFLYAFCVCVNPAFIPAGLYKSWGGGVPTSDIDWSIPRFHCLCLKFYSFPSRPICLNRFCICRDSLLHPTAPPISSHSLLKHLSVTPSLNLLSCCRTLSTWTSPTPATRQPLPLVSAPRTAFLCLPSFPESVRPPVASLGLHPGLCRNLGGSFFRSPRLPCVLPPFLCADPLLGIFWLLISWLGFHFFVRARG